MDVLHPEMTMRLSWLPMSFAAVFPLAAQTSAPTVVPKLTIGCESCPGAAQFGRIWDVAVSPRGEVLVVNKEAPMLRRFDATGRSAWSGGPKGKGPGEFTRPDRFAFTPKGMIVIDGGNNRVTELTPAGEVTRSTPLTSMATTAAVNRDGAAVIGFDDFGRSFRIVSKPLGASEVHEVARFPGSFKNKAAAIAPDGGIAVVLDASTYEIRRLDARGNPLPAVTRDIPRPRRTAVEEAEYQQRLNSDLGAMAAAMKAQGGDGKVKPPDIPPAQRGLKAHIMTDGLRFDDGGRLWVWTLRGDETKTIFDVFAADGSYLGEVTIPMRITSYGLGGAYLAAAGENSDGIPIVEVWTVK
jgi:hypothetical protein